MHPESVINNVKLGGVVGTQLARVANASVQVGHFAPVSLLIHRTVFSMSPGCASTGLR